MVTSANIQFLLLNFSNGFRKCKPDKILSLLMLCRRKEQIRANMQKKRAGIKKRIHEEKMTI